MLSVHFYENKVSVRERNIKQLLETVTYIAITETVTSIIITETVTCIKHCRNYHLYNCNRKHCRNYHLHDCNRDFKLHNYIKNCHHIFASEALNYISETVTQNLHNYNRRCFLYNCYGKHQLQSSNRNCHLQNCLQKLSLLMVSDSDYFKYKNEVEQMSKH